MESKSFNIRLPKELWLYLKRAAAQQDTSMMQIIIEAIKDHKKKQEWC